MRTLAPTLLLLGVALMHTAAAAQNDVSAQIQQLKQQVEQLQKQLDQLQRQQGAQEGNANLGTTVQQIKDTLEEPEGAVQTTISDVAKLKKIGISGYLVGRYENYPNLSGRLNKGDNSSIDNRFFFREARFKVTGQPTDRTLAALQVEMGGLDRSKLETKDAYLEYHPWGKDVPAPFFIRFGQQNMPFGYTVERSSSVREAPERAKVFAGTSVSLPGYPSFSGLFPGERDKGIALFSTAGSKLDWGLGLFNGTFTKAGNAGSAYLESTGKFEDNNAAKTVIGRVRYPFTESLHVGGSMFIGNQAVRAVSDATSAVNVKQTRWGLDAEYYLPGASIKGEYVSGDEPYYSNTTTTPNGKSGTNRTVSGWYVTGVKNLGTQYQAVAQYDVLHDQAMDSTFGKLSSWNVGLVRFLDEATRVRAFYEINSEEKNSIDNNGFRLDIITVF